MDDLRFDAWTRRRVGLAAGGGLAALLGLLAPHARAAKKKRNRRRKQKQRCRRNPNRTWCGNECVRGECCPGKPCGGDDGCACALTAEGQAFCYNDVGVLCVGVETCPDSAACAAGLRCVPLAEPCGPGDVTALCYAPCGTGP